MRYKTKAIIFSVTVIFAYTTITLISQIKVSNIENKYDKLMNENISTEVFIKIAAEEKKSFDKVMSYTNKSYIALSIGVLIFGYFLLIYKKNKP